ncbi:MAG: indole-3-glycerol phosphate synthase TrpC [Gemmatimonadales bacterium]|nr:indole-3-glycerol phosphate synthase TrpC [Gemmatimonadales bacterium]
MTEAQGTNEWSPAGGPLGELTRASEARALRSRARLAELERAASDARPAPAFAAGLRGAHVRVIAEIKRRSPSKGRINDDLEAGARGQAYEAGGAAALSVLTEPERFGGTLADLSAARAAVRIPLLRKDFLTDESQLLEARVHGASAVLLIARALAPARLAALAAEARALALECLIEVRDERELERAVREPGAVIGVNNRDLETLLIDAAVGDRLLPQVPADRVAVYESGVQGVLDVERAASVGADAVLVGSVLSAHGAAAAATAAVRALAAVPRRPRG